MRRNQLFLLLCLVSLGCAPKRFKVKESQAPEQVEAVTLKAGSETWRRPTDCRNNIKKAVCVVTKYRDNVPPGDPKCEGEEEKYVEQFQALYDSFPKSFQDMFCSLRKIYVERSLKSTAYRGEYTNSNGSRAEGISIGIRKSLLDEEIVVDRWASWKEQLSFGADKKNYDLVSGYPSYAFVSSTAKKPRVNETLFLIIAHEFAHGFDLANNVNQFDRLDCSTSSGCRALKNTWSSLSWDSERRPKLEQDFLHRNKLCFYNCNGLFLGLEVISDLYESLWKSSYINLYAATNPWDDFAETVSYLLAEECLGFQMRLYVSDGKSLNINEKLRADQFRKKYEYAVRLLGSADLKYP